jgi:hypothetical protein
MRKSAKKVQEEKTRSFLKAGSSINDINSMLIENSILNSSTPDAKPAFFVFREAE